MKFCLQIVAVVIASTMTCQGAFTPTAVALCRGTAARLAHCRIIAPSALPKGTHGERALEASRRATAPAARLGLPVKPAGSYRGSPATEAQKYIIDNLVIKAAAARRSPEPVLSAMDRMHLAYTNFNLANERLTDLLFRSSVDAVEQAPLVIEFVAAFDTALQASQGNKPVITGLANLFSRRVIDFNNRTTPYHANLLWLLAHAVEVTGSSAARELTALSLEHTDCYRSTARDACLIATDTAWDSYLDALTASRPE